ncbi:MAG: hypothetical protein NVV74_24130 [Magnetospirillum sp.]|nr:hypothetical protein [Magnetospirillum sp.]
MRRAALAAALCMLAACGEVAGVSANAALKSHQSRSAEELESRIAQRFAAEPALTGLKVSVARANGWRDGFQTRTSVLLAGTATDAAARTRAAELVREIIGGDPAAIAILDRSRMPAE